MGLDNKKDFPEDLRTLLTAMEELPVGSAWHSVAPGLSAMAGEPAPDEFDVTDNRYIEGVDTLEAKAFELAFPAELIQFMTDINFTQSAEDVFQLLVAFGKRAGFKMVAYEYCNDVTAKDAHIFTRSNLPQAMIAMERWMRNPDRVSYGRRHCTYKWTPGVSGAAFNDMYNDYPDYQRKLSFAQILPGVHSGIGIPLRSPDPKARAGMSFSGRMGREECLAFVAEKGPTLLAIAWAAHARMMQHMVEARTEGIDLTERQLQFIDLVAEGLIDKQIAHEMKISHSGVRKHQIAICRKLRVKRRSEIVPEAQRRGILSNPELDMSVGPKGAWDISVFRGGAKS